MPQEATACVVFSTQGVTRHGTTIPLGAWIISDTVNPTCAALQRLQDASGSAPFQNLDVYHSGNGLRVRADVLACSRRGARRAADRLARLLRSTLDLAAAVSELATEREVERVLA